MVSKLELIVDSLYKTGFTFFSLLKALLIGYLNLGDFLVYIFVFVDRLL